MKRSLDADTTTGAPPPPRARNILLLNNYSMRDAIDGAAPSNHLFGCANLPPGWTFTTPPHMAHPFLRKFPWSGTLVGAMWATIGDPVQTLWTMRNASRSTLVWATTQAVAPTLGVLRRIRLLKIPLVVLVHNTAARRYTRFWLRGADAIVVFSDGIRNKLIQQGVMADRIHVAPWGPDTAWPGYQAATGEPSSLDFMSTGKTYRDYTSLAEAARIGHLDGEIFRGADLLRFSQGQRTQVTNRPRLSNVEVIQALDRARVVVIPVSDPREPNGLTGITELADAVAIGRPVVMTENALLPLDIDALGIGVSIPRGADPKLVLSAIRKAQALDREAVRAAARTWNERIFSQVLLKVFEHALSASDKSSNRNK